MAKKILKNSVLKVVRWIQRSPMISFVILLAILFGVIFIANALRAPEVSEQEKMTVQKKVHVIHNGDERTLEVMGHVEKNDVVMVEALTSGVVQRIHVNSGQVVSQGEVLVTLSDNYSGSTSAQTALEIARRNVEFQSDTFEKNIGIVDDQRDDVARTDSLANEIARKQLTLQKRNLELQKDLSTLQLKQANSMLERYSPVAFSASTVERVFVSPGDNVQPGDRLMALYTKDTYARVVAMVGESIARSLSVEAPAIITLEDGKRVEVYPQYISKVPTDDQSYSVTFVLKDGKELTDNSYINLELSLEGSSQSESLIPLDAIQLTNDAAVVFVVEEGVAKGRQVELGKVLGSYVYITQGLDNNDQVILERTVSDGDMIEIVE